jgi:formamidopyrimidine-DNA glycosylase
LFRAQIAPGTLACRLTAMQVARLRRGIRAVLREAIRWGSTLPLSHGPDRTDGLFYFGKAASAPDYYEERLRVYDRAGQPCLRCGVAIANIVQAARSTYFCPGCQFDKPTVASGQRAKSD